MRTLKNVDIDYKEGRLVVRPGYERWNAVALPAVATQLYEFTDLSGNQHLLGICNSRWYEFKATGAHVMLVDEAATAPRPIIQYGDRVVFATDTGWYWTDDAQLTGTPKYHRLGIHAPDESCVADPVAALGHTVSLFGSALILNTTTQYWIAFKLTLTDELKIGSLSLGLQKPLAINLAGNIRISLQTDSAGLPSGTLVAADARSTWWPVMWLNVGTYTLKLFTFTPAIDLAAGTYWAVINSDAAYKSSFNTVPGFSFYADVGHDTGLPTNEMAIYNNVTSTWNGVPWSAWFQIGGMDDTKFYDYVQTFRNSTYGSESRQSESVRVDPTSTAPVIQVTLPAVSDPQVDIVRVYRRQVENRDDVDPVITDPYKLALEGAPGDVLHDTLPTASLGGILQTQDHYAYDEVDSGDDAIRPTALLPGPAAQFKERIWIAEPDGIVLYPSKILEEDGACGRTNTAMPDYFPLGNALEFGVSSSILALETMADEQLVIYFKDESVYVLWGANESLNPPPDVQRRPVLSKGGLFGSRSMDASTTRHIIMTSDGLWGFSGNIGIPELLSETNHSIFTSIENTYLENTRVLIFGGEIWVLHDADNDGDMESILILDMLRDVPTRQIVDRAWRTYEYDVPLNDIVLRRRGSTFKHILAADATNPYILKLGEGTLDNGNAIVASVEMHNLQAKNLVMISGVELDAKYPGTPPTYSIQGISSGTVVQTRTLTPSSDTDIRKHRTGLRVMAVTDARILIEMTSTQRDELKSFLVNYVTE
jgi:hypothetical protein